jgi:hypothetical protein
MGTRETIATYKNMTLWGSRRWSRKFLIAGRRSHILIKDRIEGLDLLGCKIAFPIITTLIFGSLSISLWSRSRKVTLA